MWYKHSLCNCPHELLPVNVIWGSISRCRDFKCDFSSWGVGVARSISNSAGSAAGRHLKHDNHPTKMQTKRSQKSAAFAASCKSAELKPPFLAAAILVSFTSVMSCNKRTLKAAHVVGARKAAQCNTWTRSRRVRPFGPCLPHAHMADSPCTHRNRSSKNNSRGREHQMYLSMSDEPCAYITSGKTGSSQNLLEQH